MSARRRLLLLYALRFLVAIFVFAGMYTLLPGQFYHSTIKWEEAYKTESRALRASLWSVLTDSTSGRRSQFVTPQGTGYLSGFVPFRAIEVAEIDRIVIRAGTMAYFDAPQRFATPVAFDISFDVPRVIPSPAATSRQSILVGFWYQVQQTAGPTMPGDALLGALRADERSQHGQAWISEELADRIARYADAARLIPVGFRGTFPRMLYYSVVTITTLGYGDIVPLTNCARILTAIEAVVGVVLLGAFVNALTSRPSE